VPIKGTVWFSILRPLQSCSDGPAGMSMDTAAYPSSNASHFTLWMTFLSASRGLSMLQWINESDQDMRQQNLGTSKRSHLEKRCGPGLIVCLKHHLCCSHVLVAWTCDLVHLSTTIARWCAGSLPPFSGRLARARVNKAPSGSSWCQMPWPPQQN